MQQPTNHKPRHKKLPASSRNDIIHKAAYNGETNKTARQLPLVKEKTQHRTMDTHIYSASSSLCDSIKIIYKFKGANSNSAQKASNLLLDLPTTRLTPDLNNHILPSANGDNPQPARCDFPGQ